MAYITTEEVAKVRDAVKAEFPSYKFSIKRHHYSTINISLMSADFDIEKDNTYINPFYVEENKNPEIVRIFTKVKEILFALVKYHNNTDVQSDYFDVAYYFDFRIGQWDKPYIKKIKNKKVLDKIKIKD